jgi:hypothetical protein
MGRTLTMMDWLRTGGCLRACWIVCMALLLGSTGNRAAMAQGVTTTNEVRAMRGLGPITGSSSESQVSEARPGAPTGVRVQVPTVGELQGE